MKENALSLCLISRSPDETLAIGRILGEQLGAGDTVALLGELGSGKTCLTQGIALGLQVPETYGITSPTFTLINEYPGRVKLYHMDMYRLSGPGDLEDMGGEDYFYGDGVAVVEWAEKISEVLPEETIFILLRYIDETSRELRLEGRGDRAGIIKAALKAGGFY
jgi:tRNA threonylcarbamoyladenosine biosynthesis protein TsaE